ncbi:MULTISPECIES: hypothetical protein [Aerosakkonema]
MNPNWYRSPIPLVNSSEQAIIPVVFNSAALADRRSKGQMTITKKLR